MFLHIICVSRFLISESDEGTTTESESHQTGFISSAQQSSSLIDFKHSFKITPLLKSKPILTFSIETQPKANSTTIQAEEACLSRFVTTSDTISFELNPVETVFDPNQDPKNLISGLTCAICSKTFKRKGSVLSHVRNIHLGQKPFKCLECDKAFAGNAFLQDHLRARHRGEKENHSCQFCDKTFAFVGNLRTHLKKQVIRKKSLQLTLPINYSNFKRHL